MQELKDELLLYPRGKHDDLLDGLYYATKKIYQPFHKKSQKNQENEENYTKKKENSWFLA